MKVFNDDKVYVQNNDLQYLLRACEGSSIPSSIFNKVFGDIYIVTNDNRYEFVEFSNPEDIEFFKNCDWIINYHDFDEMTEEEIVSYGSQINDKRNELAGKFNNLSEKEKEKQYEKVSSEIMMLDYKIYSIRDLLWHRQGHLKFSIPSSNTEVIQSENGFFKRLSRKFKKNINR